MSSYLNIYGIPKEGDKPIEIVSFSSIRGENQRGTD